MQAQSLRHDLCFLYKTRLNLFDEHTAYLAVAIESCFAEPKQDVWQQGLCASAHTRMHAYRSIASPPKSIKKSLSRSVRTVPP